MNNCFPSGTLKVLTNAHAIRGRPILKDIERQLQNGSFHQPKKCHSNAKITQNNAKQTQSNAKGNVKNNAKDTQMISKITRARSYKRTNTDCLVRRDFTEKCSEEKVRENIPRNMDAIFEFFI